MFTEIFPREHPEFDNHRVFRFEDESVGIKAGFICIHSLIPSPIALRFGVTFGSIGGFRIYPYKDETSALGDALRLSRWMSYKAMSAGLSVGGGKIAVMGNPKTVKTEAFLRRCGMFITELNERFLVPNYDGIFTTGEDSGVTPKDVDIMALETAYVFGTTDGAGDPSLFTAPGVTAGIEECLQVTFGDQSLRKRSFAVQGVGRVGTPLVRDFLHKKCGSINISDTDEGCLSPFRNAPGILIVPPGEIFSRTVDVFSPCALGGILNEETIGKLNCKIVAGSANNQLARKESDHARLLHARKILYAPDFIINAGGLIHVYFAQCPDEYDEGFVRLYIVSTIKDSLRFVFEESRETRKTPHDVAVDSAIDLLQSADRAF